MKIGSRKFILILVGILLQGGLGFYAIAKMPGPDAATGIASITYGMAILVAGGTVAMVAEYFGKGKPK